MAEATAKTFCFLVVALSFLPLTCKNGVVSLLLCIVSPKTQSIDFQFTDS